MPVLAVTLELPPGHLAINARSTVTTVATRNGRKPKIVKAPRYRAGQAEAYLAVRRAVIAARWRTAIGPCCALIVTHWPTDEGDVDATTKAVLDALQHGQAVSNDRQIAPVVLDHTHCNPQPRIDVWLCTSVAEFVPLLPWSP